MVLDTSVLLAIFFKEKHYEWAAEQMNQHASLLRMSTVNLTETLIHLQDRQPHLFEAIKKQILSNGICFISPDIEQSEIAAKARMELPLNLGDCFVYALAVKENCRILTLDKDFKVLGDRVVHPY